MNSNKNCGGKSMLEYVLIAVLVALVSFIVVFVLERFFNGTADNAAQTIAQVSFAEYIWALFF